MFSCHKPFLCHLPAPYLSIRQRQLFDHPPDPDLNSSIQRTLDPSLTKLPIDVPRALVLAAPWWPNPARRKRFKQSLVRPMLFISRAGLGEKPLAQRISEGWPCHAIPITAPPKPAGEPGRPPRGRWVMMDGHRLGLASASAPGWRPERSGVRPSAYRALPRAGLVRAMGVSFYPAGRG